MRRPLSIEQRRGRGGSPFERLKAQVYAEETHCCLCGEWVDQSLPWRHPMSKSIEHRDGDCANNDRSNLGIAHRTGNVRSGNWRRYHPEYVGRVNPCRPQRNVVTERPRRSSRDW